MSTREYNPKLVNATLGGRLLIKGFADGTFLEMQRAVPRTEIMVGAKGDVGITKSANYTGTVTFTLLQNSPTNQYLSAIVNAEDAADELFRADIVVDDKSGSVLAIAKMCHIQEPAPIILGDGQNAKVWTFFSEEIHYLPVPEGIPARDAVVDGVEMVAAIRAVSENVRRILN